MEYGPRVSCRACDYEAIRTGGADGFQTPAPRKPMVAKPQTVSENIKLLGGLLLRVQGTHWSKSKPELANVSSMT